MAQLEKHLDFIVDLHKGQRLVDADETYTLHAMRILHNYATQWLDGRRDLSLERLYPELTDGFMDIRLDREYAQERAQPFEDPTPVLPV